MIDTLGLLSVIEPPAFGRVDVAAPDGSGDFIASIYDGHQRELYTFALRACGDRDAAEDLVHEAFLRLIVEIEANRVPDNVRAWLYRVTANLVSTRGRRATVARKWLGFFASSDTVAGPEPVFLDAERRSDLEAVLAELAPDARTALLLAAHGFSGQDIAVAIGRSDSATRTLMCRTRLRLRERLESMA
jgi:RNA polymerase sigma factor (sigma-70 family)